MKRVMIILVILTGSLPAWSQTISLNHGQQGGFGVIGNNSLSLLSPEGGVGFMIRQQWVGLDGAPHSFVGTGHIGIARFGATTGISVRQDGIGLERHTEASAFFAKSIRLSASDYMGMSINVGLVHYTARFSTLDPSDQSFRDDVVERDGLLGIGLVLYRPEVYFIGASLPRITRGGVGIFGDTRYKFQNQYHLTGGIVCALDERIHLRPSMQAVYNVVTGLQVNASAMLFADRKVGLGLGVRTQGEFSALLRLNFSGFGFGYSYQFSPGNKPLNRRINNSTHEIGLNYEFSGLQRIL